MSEKEHIVWSSWMVRESHEHETPIEASPWHLKTYKRPANQGLSMALEDSKTCKRQANQGLSMAPKDL
ncbi:hypothetical protein CR513_43067, partial [Mucuna pruriens]